jgi:hypothetical protein
MRKPHHYPTGLQNWLEAAVRTSSTAPRWISMGGYRLISSIYGTCSPVPGRTDRYRATVAYISARMCAVPHQCIGSGSYVPGRRENPRWLPPEFADILYYLAPQRSSTAGFTDSARVGQFLPCGSVDWLASPDASVSAADYPGMAELRIRAQRSQDLVSHIARRRTIFT